MEALTADDQKHLEAARDWLERKDYTEAKLQLDKVSDAGCNHPDILDATMRVHYGLKNHLRTVDAGLLLVGDGKCLDRVSVWLTLADSLHQLGRTQEAYEKLRVFSSHGCRTGLVYYKLAVYACLLGKPDEAKMHFASAMTTPEGAKLKRDALEDKQLQDIWDFLCQP